MMVMLINTHLKVVFLDYMLPIVLKIMVMAMLTDRIKVVLVIGVGIRSDEWQ